MDTGRCVISDEAPWRRRHFSLALLLLMVFSILLVSWRVQQSELEIARARGARQLAEVAAEIEKAFGFGLSARDLGPLTAFLEARRADDESLVAAWIFDEAGELTVGVGCSPESGGFDLGWQRRLDDGMRIQTVSRPPRDFLGMIVVDSLGRPGAQVWMVHDRSRSYRNGERVAVALTPLALAATLIAIGTLVAVARFANPALRGRWRAAASLASLALLVVVPIMIQAQALTRPLIDAQVEASAQQFARAVGIRVGHALDIGIPLRALPGVEAVLRAQLAPAREFAAIALVDADGVRLASALANGISGRVWGDPAFTQASAELRGGAAVLVRYSRDYTEKMMSAALGDLAFAVLIAGVLAWELVQAVRMPDRRVSGPALTSLADLRLFVFVVALSEELLRPFLVSFAAEAESSLPLLAGWSSAALAGLPVATFMIALAVAQPCGAVLAGRFDLRRAMLAVTLLGAVALAAAGLASDISELALLRFANGASYGLSLIFVQMAMLRLVPPGQRARTLAGFATAIVAAGIAGPALGAILAERFGYQIAFVACASTYVAAAMLCWKMRFDGNGQADTETSSLRALGDFLRQRDALAVTILAAVPARLLAAAVLILMAPLYLFEAGESTTVVGRVLPLYFVGFLAAAPAFAAYSDRSGRHKSCVVAGCVLSGIGCAAVPWVGGVVGAGIGCVLLGLGQAALSAPQLAWVVDLCAHRGHAAVEQGVAAFRFLERVGSVAAAPVVALCVQGVGLSSGFAALGGGVALAGLALLLLRTPFGRERGIEEGMK